MLQKNKKMVIEEHLFYYLSVTCIFGNKLESDLVRRMMEKDPNKRISVEEALEHPYFLDEIDDDDIVAE